MAAAGAPGPSCVGVLIGGRHWLVDMTEILEVVAPPRLTRVPHAAPWFAGVTGLHGTVWSVVDLASFFGAAPAPGRNQRILMVRPEILAQSGLLVDAVLGLRHVEDWTPLERPAASPAWLADMQADADGHVWHRLSVRELTQQPAFLDIAAPRS